jgi:hypothetical protein
VRVGGERERERSSVLRGCVERERGFRGSVFRHRHVDEVEAGRPCSAHVHRGRCTQTAATARWPKFGHEFPTISGGARNFAMNRIDMSRRAEAGVRYMSIVWPKLAMNSQRVVESSEISR